ncbi:MAG: ASPIC/UnbV domain-containing protein, partial [Planctomycetales bacterium]|nr:ASPIC/UnbV domain-containing protein [Planctomycetales bacterium]
LVANQRGPLLIYRNTVAEDRHWIDFELNGTQSNRSAIGAQVRVFWDGQQQLQELVAASGYAAQNQRRLHFGLGQLPKVDRVEIHWPSGIVQTLESPAVDQVHRVEESP